MIEGTMIILFVCVLVNAFLLVTTDKPGPRAMFVVTYAITIITLTLKILDTYGALTLHING